VSKKERRVGLSEREPGGTREAVEGGGDGGRRGLIMEF